MSKTSKTKFWTWFKKKYTFQERKIFLFLRKNLYFSSFNDDELYEILPSLHLREYRKNEVIFFRNDPSQAFYVIKSGRVALTLDIGDKFEELTVLHSTQSFGDNALIESSRRIYNAVCVADRCEIYVIPRLNLNEIFEHNVSIRAKMYKAMSERYNTYTANLFKAYIESFGFFDLGKAYPK